MYVVEQRARYAIVSDKRPPKNPRRPMRIKAEMTIRDVFRKLRRILEREGLIDEYFSLSDYSPDSHINQRRKLGEFMRAGKYTWFAAYAVTGGSEGHYIHVDFATQYGVGNKGEVFHFITGKTFQGMQHALKIANRCAELLGD